MSSSCLRCVSGCSWLLVPWTIHSCPRHRPARECAEHVSVTTATVLTKARTGSHWILAVTLEGFIVVTSPYREESEVTEGEGPAQVHTDRTRRSRTHAQQMASSPSTASPRGPRHLWEKLKNCHRHGLHRNVWAALNAIVMSATDTL